MGMRLPGGPEHDALPPAAAGLGALGRPTTGAISMVSVFSPFPSQKKSAKRAESLVIIKIIYIYILYGGIVGLYRLSYSLYIIT